MAKSFALIHPIGRFRASLKLANLSPPQSQLALAIPYVMERMLVLQQWDVLKQMEEINRELLNPPVMPMPPLSSTYSDNDRDADSSSDDNLQLQLEREMSLPSDPEEELARQLTTLLKLPDADYTGLYEDLSMLRYWNEIDEIGETGRYTGTPVGTDAIFIHTDASCHAATIKMEFLTFIRLN
jgi:hypothetical protein